MSAGAELLVAIRPDARTFGPDLQRVVSAAGAPVATAFGAMGVDSARRLQTELAQGITRIVGDLKAVSAAPIEIRGDTTDIDGAVTAVEGDLGALGASDTTVTVTADTATAQSDVTAVGTAVTGLVDGTVTVTADAATAKTDVGAVGTAVSDLADKSIKVTADTATASSNISTLSTAVTSIPAGTVKVTAETSAATSAIAAFSATPRTAPVAVALETDDAEEGLTALFDDNGELTVEVAANVEPASLALQAIIAAGQLLEVAVEANTSKAVEALDGLTSTSPVVTVEADGSAVDAEIDRLRGVAGQGMEVVLHASADTAGAIADLDQVQSRAPDVVIDVDADTAPAEDALNDLESSAEESGTEGGRRAGGGLVGGITDGLGVLSTKSGPLVGSIIGAVGFAVTAISSLSLGGALVGAILSGSEGLAEQGLFSARTGLDTETAKRFAVAAGESYAQNFGDSISTNLETARAAFSAGILGGDATTQEITNVTNGLTTVADILGEDVPNVAKAAGQAVKTGLAEDVTGALDLIVAANQNGLNVSEDLLDTINEYGVQFQKVGLDGETAFALIGQATRNGARDTDLAADAIKEFSIRAIDGSATTVEAYQAIGLNAEEMQTKIAGGGPVAQEALGQVFDALSKIEDPATKATAATGLFGTQAEDLGAALGSFNLETARAEFGSTADALANATSKIGTDPAAALETAKRGIEVSATSIKESIALAFAPQVTGFSEWVSGNRGAITEFAFSFADSALSFATAGAGVASSLLGAAGSVVGGLGGMVDAVLGFFEGVLNAADTALGWVPGFGDDIATAKDSITSLRESSAEASTALSEGLSSAAGSIDATLIPTLEGAQTKMNEFGIPAIAQANFADATLAATNGVEAVGVAADGTNLAVSNLGGKFDTTSASGKVLDTQLKDASASLRDQVTAGDEAGATADELTSSYNTNRDALIAQIEQMGFSRDEATGIATDYGLIPDLVATTVSQPGMDTSRADVAYYDAELAKLPADAKTRIEAAGAAGSKEAVKALRDEVAALRDRTIYITSITVQRNQENTTGRAGGGWIPGAPSSVDNMMVAMASGEYVVNAADAQRNAALLEAINAGQDVNALLARATTTQTRTETVAVGGGLSAADRELLAALASRPAILQVGSHQFALAVADAEREKVRVGRR